jgi:hypothetical protein
LAAAAQQDAVTTKLEGVVDGNFVLAEKTVENIKMWELVLGGGEAQTAREREREKQVLQKYCKSGDVWRVVRCGGRTEAVYKDMGQRSKRTCAKQSFRQRRVWNCAGWRTWEGPEGTVNRYPPAQFPN